MILRLSAAALPLLLAACAATAPVAPAPAPMPAAAKGVPHDNLDATLWMQTSAEYRAALLGAYAQARQQLDLALADACLDALPEGERDSDPCGLPPAIITDADETLIDNSPLQARKIRDNAPFAYDNWLAWVNERRALALPGALEFARYAAERGVTVYFVTNRDAPQEVAATVENLRAQGFPVAADAGNVLLRGDARAPARAKGERRRWVAARHRVVMMLGDNLGDFLDGIEGGVAERAALVDRYAGWWGTRWIMLPNPAYGSWESAVLRGCGEQGRADPTACKRAALRLQ